MQEQKPKVHLPLMQETTQVDLKLPDIKLPDISETVKKKQYRCQPPEAYFIIYGCTSEGRIDDTPDGFCFPVEIEANAETQE